MSEVKKHFLLHFRCWENSLSSFFPCQPCFERRTFTVWLQSFVCFHSESLLLFTSFFTFGKYKGFFFCIIKQESKCHFLPTSSDPPDDGEIQLEDGCFKWCMIQTSSIYYWSWPGFMSLCGAEASQSTQSCWAEGFWVFCSVSRHPQTNGGKWSQTPRRFNS